MDKDTNVLLHPENCCLHLIDLQKSLMAQIHEAERVVVTARLMLNFARIMKMPILANTQYRKGLGLYVSELEPLMEGIPRPDKVEFNAIANAETQAHIRSLASDGDNDDPRRRRNSYLYLSDGGWYSGPGAHPVDCCGWGIGSE